MSKEGFFKEFTAKMKEIRSQAREKLQEIAATFFDSLEEGGYTADDLAGKTRGIWSYFNKLKNGKYDEDDLINATFHKCYESPEAWVKKSDVKEQSPLFMFVSDKLYPILKFSEEKRPEWVKDYKSATLTMKHLNQPNNVKGHVNNITTDESQDDPGCHNGYVPCQLMSSNCFA